ncbi:MAG: F0F1 ATP synthase subunit B [Candidatus Kerfeldbacteria bacterium]|nr:F0F1 ATP synthase subunit B [Candidatus Kerfeldbacteria bacterium]
MELIKAFGLDYKLLLANLINFVILFFILKKILYTPLLNFINDRTKKIEEGVRNAQEAQHVLKVAQQKHEHTLIDARKEASEIIEKAKSAAEAQANSMIERTKKETADLFEKAKLDIDQERKQMMQSAKKEIASAVIMVAEKVLRERITPEKETTMLNENLNDLH